MIRRAFQTRTKQQVRILRSTGRYATGTPHGTEIAPGSDVVGKGIGAKARAASRQLERAHLCDIAWIPARSRHISWFLSIHGKKLRRDDAGSGRSDELPARKARVSARTPLLLRPSTLADHGDRRYRRRQPRAPQTCVIP